MFCKKCGAELPEGSSFCPACGALQGFEVSATETSPDVPPTPPTGPHATSKKKKHIPLIVCLSLLVVVVAVGVTLFFTMGKPFFFQHYIQAANFDKAADTYYALSDTDREKANDWLQSYIEEIRDKYYSGEYDFTTTNAMLNDLADYNAVYTQLEGLALEIAQDSTWVTMQESAAQYIEKSDWLQGYKALQNIYPEYRNYEEVLTMRETCIKGIRSDAIVDCQVLAKTGDYRALQEKMDAALEILPQDKELTLAYQDFMDSFVADTLAHAEELFQAGDVDAAISTLSDAEDIYYSEQFTTTISKYVRDDAEAAAAAFAERGDYLGALKLLQDTQLESGESLTDLTSQYEKLLEEDTLNKAAALAADRRFWKPLT